MCCLYILEQFRLYVLFIKQSNKYIAYTTVTALPASYPACLVSANLTDMTLTATEHHRSEIINALLAEKYAGLYTVEPKGTYEYAVAYDAEYDVYIVFLSYDSAFKYAGSVADKSLVAGMEIAIVDTVTKIISYN